MTSANNEGESKMTNIKTLIEREFDAFFEFETDNRDVVTSTSAKLFAEHVVGIVAAPDLHAVQGEPVAVMYEDGSVLSKADCGDNFEFCCKVLTPLYAADKAVIQEPEFQAARAQNGEDGESLARRFHEIYERLAPTFGYQTRDDTKQFDPKSANGRLMVAVCKEILAHPLEQQSAPDVEALEAIQKASTIKGIHTGVKAGLALGRIEAICDIALQYAHRKQGGEQ